MRTPVVVTTALAFALSACAEPATLPAPRSTVEELLKNAGDPEDEVMNLNLLTLANALVAVVRDEELLAFVLSEAAKDPDGEVRFAALALRSERFRSVMDSSLAGQAHLHAGQGFLALRDAENRMMYRGIAYYPNISIPNLNVARTGRAPIVAIGSQVTEDDEIVGWDLRDGGARPVLVSREAASAPGAPVMIVNNGTDELPVLSPAPPDFSTVSAGGVGPSQQGAPINQVLKFSRYQVRAGYHFEEKWNRADFAYVVMLYNLSSWQAYSFSPYYTTELIDRIAKSQSDKNTVFNKTVPFTGTVSEKTLGTYPRMFIVVFEYDWWAKRHLITCGPLSHRPQMKYAQEYYVANCNIHIPTLFPAVGSTYELSSWKGSVTFKRTT